MKPSRAKVIQESIDLGLLVLIFFIGMLCGSFAVVLYARSNPETLGRAIVHFIQGVER